MRIKYLPLLALLFCAPLKSEQTPSLFSLGVGIYNVVKEKRAFQVQMEYKWGYAFYHIQPFTALFTTNQGATYFCAGLCGDIFLGDKVVVTPSFAPGIYFQGHGKNLGYPLEFRSSLALSYVLKNKDRIGAQFYHISNASLGHRNPGVESLIFFYAISFD